MQKRAARNIAMETEDQVSLDSEGRAPRSGRHKTRRAVMWIKPAFVELRFGFEVTMYSEYR